MQTRLLNHLTKFNILTKEQFVFTTVLVTEMLHILLPMKF